MSSNPTIPQDVNSSESEGEKSKQTITQAPHPHPDMELQVSPKEYMPQAGVNNSSESTSRASDVSTISDMGSGYERETNEFSEFCIDCMSCFGVLDSCCPSSGEGFFVSCATFTGNIMFACCKSLR